jgi:DNA-binding protein Fis
MGSIPILAANGIQQGTPPSALEAQQRMEAIKTSQQQQQLQGQQIEQQQQQLKDQQAMTQAMQSWDGKDFNELPSLVLKHGGSANAVIGLKQHIVDQQTKLAQLDSDQLSKPSPSGTICRREHSRH